MKKKNWVQHVIYPIVSLPQAQHRQSYNVHYVQGLRQIAARQPSPTRPLWRFTPPPFSGAVHKHIFYCLLLAAHASFFIPLHFRASFRSFLSALRPFRYIPIINQHKPQQRKASVAPFSAFRSCHHCVPFRPDFGDTFL